MKSQGSIDLTRRLLGSVAVVASLGLAGATMTPVASASTAISVVSSGPSVLNTYTYQDSDEGYAVFTVVDPSRQGTQVSQCWVDSDDELYDCDVYPLRETDYRDGDWRIRPTASGWEIRVYLAYAEMDDEECLDQYKGAGQEGVDIAILGDFEEVLGESTHSYEVVCQGYVGTSKGGSKITAYVGRASQALPITVMAVDAAHQAVRAQSCIYSVTTGRATNCLALDMAASRTSRGWTYERRFAMSALTARQCKAVKRNPARFVYRVVFKDAVGDSLMVINHRFSVTCR